MATIDLDAPAAARAEVQQEPIVVQFRGEEFTLPASADDLPLEFLEYANLGQLPGAAYALLGEQADRFRALKPTVGDGNALIGAAARAYGFANLGESSASNGSSPNGSSRSRPTSPGSTEST